MLELIISAANVRYVCNRLADLFDLGAINSAYFESISSGAYLIGALGNTPICAYFVPGEFSDDSTEPLSFYLSNPKRAQTLAIGAKTIAFKICSIAELTELKELQVLDNSAFSVMDGKARIRNYATMEFNAVTLALDYPVSGWFVTKLRTAQILAAFYHLAAANPKRLTFILTPSLSVITDGKDAYKLDVSVSSNLQFSVHIRGLLDFLDSTPSADIVLYERQDLALFYSFEYGYRRLSQANFYGVKEDVNLQLLAQLDNLATA